MVMCVWHIVTATKCLGQAHEIDKYTPQHPPGNLIVFCPLCPQPSFNMEEGWECTPPKLQLVYVSLSGNLLIVNIHRHLNQTQITIDSNFHANNLMKNTDPDDVSLFCCWAHFPESVSY